MGDLISFPTSRNAASATSAEASPQGAQILFFTGVRYKREIETPQPAVQTAPPKGGVDGTGGGRRKRRG